MKVYFTLDRSDFRAELAAPTHFVRIVGAMGRCRQTSEVLFAREVVGYNTRTHANWPLCHGNPEYINETRIHIPGQGCAKHQATYIHLE